MSGIVGLLIGIGLRIGRRISDTINQWSDVPDWIFICIGLIFLFFAGYAAWNDKNNALLALQKRLATPQLGGRLNSVAYGDMNGEPLIVVGGIFTNPLGPPTAIVRWTIRIEFPNGEIIEGKIPLLPKDEINKIIGQTQFMLSLKHDSSWMAKGETPIPIGGTLSGWLWGIFCNLDFNDAFNNQALIVVEAEDAVAGAKHTLKMLLGRENHGLGLN